MIVSATFASENQLNAEFQQGEEFDSSVGTYDSLVGVYGADVSSGRQLTAEFQGERELNTDFGSVTRLVSGTFNFGYGLVYDEDTNTVSVDAVDDVIAGDKRPVTSSAVQIQVGNIEAILRTI